MNKSLALLLLLLVSGCADLGSFDQPGKWTATGSNDANLRVMIANPYDLREGVDAPGTMSAEAAPPVKRLFQGRRTPLPLANASQIGASNEQQPQPQPIPLNGQ
ncbi:MAG TPA: hypothetical protein DDZ81_24450 [Acetobacteraceae bacterium]|jgi:hypothetical protein|nr:hypothetical protein [Acetobacteraceae bacterium]